jgi:hypothetical protein
LLQYLKYKEILMVTTYRQAIEVRAGLNKLSTKSVNGDTVMKVLDLVDELDGRIEAHRQVYVEAFQKLMAEYGVEEKENIFNWSEHQQQTEITEKASALLDAQIKEVNTNIFENAEVIGLTHGLTVGEITAFRLALKK